jgi:hypothetical protein
MASQWELEYQKIEQAVREGFNHPRTDKRPRLPPGFDWDTQTKKYCPMWWYSRAQIITRMRHHEERRKNSAAVLRSRLEEIAAEQEPKGRFGFPQSKSERIVPALQRADAPAVSGQTVERSVERLLDEPKIYDHGHRALNVVSSQSRRFVPRARHAARLRYPFLVSSPSPPHSLLLGERSLPITSQRVRAIVTKRARNMI